MDFTKLKVVEVASVLAGPSVGMFFAELGATVYKIEYKQAGGDVTRQWKNQNENPDTSVTAYFSSVNWRKQYLSLDLTNSKDYDKFTKLLCHADIIVVNCKSDSAKKLKLDYQSVRTINSSIIYASITGFGNTNHRSAYDLVLQAETGFMSMNGTAESGPIKFPVAIIDIMAAHQLKEGILIALLQRGEDEKSKKVIVSLYDAAIASLANQASNWLMNGLDSQLIGSLHPNIAPYGEMVTCKDGKQIVLAVGNNKQFKKLCAEIGVSLLSSQSQFCENDIRVKNRMILLNLLQQAFNKFEFQDIYPKLIAADVPCGAILSLSEVFENKITKDLILEEIIQNIRTKRVKTAIFKIE